MENEAPVLIAGGGLTGLAAAAFLAQQGIRSIAVERLEQSSPLPRAAFFHMRTMEMFRGLGIEARVREESAKEFVPDGALIAMDCLSGRKLVDIISNLNEGVDAVSPCRRWFLNQPRLEPILRERAREAGATVLQGTEIVDVAQDARGVRLRVRDVAGGNERELSGRYLIGADGGHSRVRELLGIGYEGRGAFSRSLTIYFSADLSPWLGEKPWSIIYVNNPVFAGFFRMNRAGTVGFLGVNTLGDPKRDPEAAMNAAVDVSEARMIELVRAGVGVPDLAGAHRWFLALAGDRRSGAEIPGRPRVHHRRCRASDAAEWRLRRQYRDSRRAQPGLEAGERHPRSRASAAAGYVSERTPAGGALHGRTGVLALRGAHRAVARGHPDHRAHRARLRYRDRLPVRPRCGACRPAHLAWHAGVAHPSLLAGTPTANESAPSISPAAGCCSPGRKVASG